MLQATTPTCMNGSNKRLAASALIPGPVSATENCNVTHSSSSNLHRPAASASEFALRSFDGTLVCDAFVTETRITPLMTWSRHTRSQYAYLVFIPVCLNKRPMHGFMLFRTSTSAEERSDKCHRTQCKWHRKWQKTHSHMSASSYDNKAKRTRVYNLGSIGLLNFLHSIPCIGFKCPLTTCA